MRSFTALALGLSVIDLSSAGIANLRRDSQQLDVADKSENAVITWFNKFIGRDSTHARRQALGKDSCVIDNYYNFVFNSSFGENVCRALMNYPNQTIVVDTTPVSTVITTFTTRVLTHTSIVRETPYTTVTVTASPAQKRDAETTPAIRLDDVFNMFRRQNAAASDANPGLMSRSFSSACQCQTYVGSTTTSTYTAAPSIVTLSAFDQADTTVFETRTAALATTTVTVTPSDAPASPSVAPSTTDSAPSTDPTAPAITCPEDNDSTVSQLIGSMRYDYLIMCDTDITDPDFYGALYYRSFSECAAACSVANTRLQSPVCEGFSYYGNVDDQSYNCFLKGSTNSTVPASGVNSGLLQRVAVGLSGSNPAGTNTETAPFVGEHPTGSPADMSSAVSSALVNSTTAIGVTSPPPLYIPSGRLVPGQTSYSTYISDGQTFSTGTVYSTYHSASGTWYYSYYTSYSLAWSSATTVYAASETSTAVANTTNSESNTESGDNGDYWTVTTTNTTSYFPGGYNVTQVISNVTYDASGTEVTSSATTNYYSYETGGAGGGLEGGNGSGGAGIVTSTSAFSTYTVLGGGGQTGGASSFYTGGVIPSPAPSVSATTIINTFGTAYSSGLVVSGGGGGIGGASSTADSGVALSSGAPLSPISSTAVSTGIAGESGAVGSGALTPISSTIISSGLNGASSTQSSGAIPSSDSPFTNSERPRSGTYSTVQSGSQPNATPISSTVFSTGLSGVSSTQGAGAGVSSPGTIPSSGSPLSPVSSAVFSSGVAGADSTQGSGVVGSSGSPFNNSERPRSGTYSTTSTLLSGSAPIVSSGSIPSAPLGTASTDFASSSTASGSSSSPQGGESITEYIPYPTGPGPYPQFPSGPSEIISTPSSEELFTNTESSLPSSGFPQSSGFLPSSGSPFTNTNGDRTRRPSSGLSTAPTGSIPGTAPVNTQPSSPATYPGWPGPSSRVPFSNSNGDRTRRPSTASEGIPSIPTGSAPSVGIPSGSTGYIPSTGTAPVNSVPASTGSSPSGYLPPLTGSLPAGTGSVPSGTGSVPAGTGSIPSNTASSGLPFTNSNGDRTRRPSATGSSGIAPSGTAPPIPSTSLASAFPPYPTAASSCVTNFLGTTTIFTTVTESACYSHCIPPQQGYGYNPLTFGPPQGPARFQ